MTAIRLVLLCVLLGTAALGLARPLTAEEEAVLRAAPPVSEQNRTPAHLDRFRAATALARALGVEGNVDAIPVLIEARQLNVLNEFVAGYRPHDATPQLEAIALRHLGDAEIAARLVAMLRRRAVHRADRGDRLLRHAGDDGERVRAGGGSRRGRAATMIRSNTEPQSAQRESKIRIERRG